MSVLKHVRIRDERQVHLCARVSWHTQIQYERARRRTIPVTDNLSVHRLIFTARASDALVQMRVNDDLLVARGRDRRVDPGHGTIYPRHHRSERIVVIRIHGWIARIPVPTLPPRGSPL